MELYSVLKKSKIKIYKVEGLEIFNINREHTISEIKSHVCES